jgi:hypothetical protein
MAFFSNEEEDNNEFRRQKKFQLQILPGLAHFNLAECLVGLLPNISWKFR